MLRKLGLFAVVASSETRVFADMLSSSSGGSDDRHEPGSSAFILAAAVVVMPFFCLLAAYLTHRRDVANRRAEQAANENELQPTHYDYVAAP